MARPAGVSSVDIFSSLGSRIQPSASNVRSAVIRTQSESGLMPFSARAAMCVSARRKATSYLMPWPGDHESRKSRISARQSP